MPFGPNELVADPAIALPPPTGVKASKPGPLHRVQFVVEFVGPRSVPGSYAAQILTPSWYSALGKPNAWYMGPLHDQWQVLTTDAAGSFDSLAITWDILSPEATLSTGIARGLLARAEEYAGHIQRRAMAMPVPEDIDSVARRLADMRDQLDVGFSLAIGTPSGFIAERDLWVACARLGLQFSNQGSFDWVSPHSDLPLLSVTPIGQTESFSLGAADRGDVHEGASVGFRLPLCPSPPEALAACFHVGTQIAKHVGGVLFDEDENQVTPKTLKSLSQELNHAERLFAQAGIAPGSAEAKHVFW